MINHKINKTFLQEYMITKINLQDVLKVLINSENYFVLFLNNLKMENFK